MKLSDGPKGRVWFYPPHLNWITWKPLWFSSDEFHRKTLVIGYPFIGMVVFALWHFPDECGICDIYYEEELYL